MKIIFAPDSFKKSLSAVEVAEILKKKAVEFFPDCEIQMIPLTDGGDGLVDILISLLKGERGETMARDCLGEAVSVQYGVIYGDTMVIEASKLLSDKEESSQLARQKIMFSSSYGVGEMIQHGLDKGYRKFYIGAGESVVNDGGMGCAQALGVCFYDKDDQELDASGINLQSIVEIDDSGLDSRIWESEITIMCSVNNTLTGYKGVTYVYGAQNGATPEELICLERGMRNYAEIIEYRKGISICDVTGTGACGGLPAALYAFCGAKLTSGISTALKLLRFEELVESASLVIVGEAMIDQTTVYGKAITGIGMLCKAKGIPVIAITESMGRGAEQLYHYGVDSIMTSVNACMDEDYVIENAEELLMRAAERMFRLLVSGMQMQDKENCLAKSRGYVFKKEKEEYHTHWAVDSDFEE